MARERSATDVVLDPMRAYWRSRVLLTTAELDLLTRLDESPDTAERLAADLDLDERATTRLLDALVVLGLVLKEAGRYAPSESGRLLSTRHPRSVRPMALHLATLWESWSGLTETVRSGRNERHVPVNEGDAARREAFILGMHVLGREQAGAFAAAYDASGFRRLLDIGGATGSYAQAFLERWPGMGAVVFDLPPVIELARKRLGEEGLLDRIDLVPGDFYEDELPGGCDLALLSAIIHQNSREQNVELYRKVLRALEPGGALLVRDCVMDGARTSPPPGALFALNMLLCTEGGDTYTFGEMREDLEAAGFGAVRLVQEGEYMDGLVEARPA
jgi:predicted O-methyltransferase YrrM